jgi:hypothetical protein
MYSSLNIFKVIKSRKMKPSGHVACNGDKKKAYRILLKKTEGNRPHGRPRHKWEGIIKLYFNK